MEQLRSQQETFDPPPYESQLTNFFLFVAHKTVRYAADVLAFIACSLLPYALTDHVARHHPEVFLNLNSIQVAVALGLTSGFFSSTFFAVTQTNKWLQTRY